MAVGDHLNGGNWRLVGEYTEIESGKRSDRPKLAEALKAALVGQRMQQTQCCRVVARQRARDGVPRPACRRCVTCTTRRIGATGAIITKWPLVPVLMPGGTFDGANVVV